MPNPEQLRILILIIPLILIFSGMFRPVLAAIGYMLLVYCKTSFYYPIVSQIQGELVFAIIILVRLAFEKSALIKLSIASDKINKYLFYLILSICLSFAISWDHQHSWDIAVYHFIKTLLLYIMIVCSIDSRKDLKLFIFSFIAMFLYLAYEPTYGFITGTGGSQHLYGTNYQSDIGILAGHVALANNMNQMIPIAWFLMFASKEKYLKWISALSLGCFVIALIGSGSRGGIIGLTAVALCIVYFSKKQLKAALIGGLIVMVLGLTIGSSAIHTASRIDSGSTEGRLTGLTHGIGMLQRGNLLGVGPGCYLIARAKYFSYRMESHNIYGQVMGDLGIPGLIVCFFFIRELFRGLRFVKQQSKGIHKDTDLLYYLMIGMQVSLITRLVVSMASHGLYYFYWYVMAALIVSSRHIITTECNKV